MLLLERSKMSIFILYLITYLFLFQENQASENISRRRPRTVVKCLTTSELSEKYNKLLNERLEIAHYQNQHLQNSIKMEVAEHKLRMELLQSQIESNKTK